MYEILLSEEECPLDIAVESKRKVRFVLKVPQDQDMANQNGALPGLTDSARHKMLSKFFGVNTSELTLPFSQSLPSTHDHLSNGFDSPRSDTHSNSDAISLSSSNSSSSSFSNTQRKTRGQKPVLGSNGVTGLLLKPQTPRFKRKAPGPGHEHRNIRPPNRTQKKRHRPKSLTLMLERSLSLKRRQNGSGRSQNGKELSTEESAPGVLKVFGDSICPGSNYKSILASASSSAVELVKEILTRYSLPRSAHREYVLCDVIGKFISRKQNGLKKTEKEDSQDTWIEECVRPLADNEKPLLLQSFWKPDDGLVRRFEIRRRLDLPPEEIDSITSGINKNARRLQMSRSHAVPNETCLDRLDNGENGVDMENGFFNGDLASHSSPRSSIIRSQDQNLSMEREETESSDEPLACNIRMPSELPYFLTLHGYDNQDLLMHMLTKEVMLVGNRHIEPEEDDSDELYTEGVDISLEAPDILPQHCWVFRQQRHLEGQEDSREEESEFVVRLETLPDAHVIINGVPVTGSATLNPGDFVCFGHHYAFMYKDPAACTSPAMFPWSIPATMTQRRWVAPNQYLAQKAKDYANDKQRIKVLYRPHDEDQIIGWIGQHLEKADTKCPLGISYLLASMVEYSAYHFHQTNAKSLIIKTSTLIQGIAWDTTKSLANRPTEKPEDVHATMATLLPDLRLLLICMANALELLNFYQNHLHNYLASQTHHKEGISSTPSTSSSSSSSSSSSEQVKSPREVEEGEQEVLSILEEVMMYTFQQCVYYLTKTLYVVLPAVLDSNPFLDEPSDGRSSPSNSGMEKVIYVFQSTYDLLHEVGVHSQITSQLFAYLLFFTNASLFNMLMERGVGGKFFKWSKGAQIRGNLDLLEMWIYEKDLKLQASFLQKVSMATDLLATPKLQLAQAEWSSVRRDFPVLNAAQIHQMLSEYDIGGSQATRPRAWFPPPKEVEAALKTEEILVSFDDHPPLVLPTDAFQLDLRCDVCELLPGFKDILQALHKDFPKIRIKTDHGDINLPVFDEESSIEETTGPEEDLPFRDKRKKAVTPKARSRCSSWPPNEKDAGAILDDNVEVEKRVRVANEKEAEVIDPRCQKLMQELELNGEVNNNVRNVRARSNVRRQTSLSALPDPKPKKPHPTLTKSYSCPSTANAALRVLNGKVETDASGSRTLSCNGASENGHGGKVVHVDRNGIKTSPVNHVVKPILKNKKPKPHRMDIENGISHITQDVILEEDGETCLPPPPPVSPKPTFIPPSPRTPRSPIAMPTRAPSPLPSPPMSPMDSKKPSTPPPPPPKPKTRPSLNGFQLPRTPSPPTTNGDLNGDLKLNVIAPPLGFDSSPEERRRREDERRQQADRIKQEVLRLEGKDAGRTMQNGDRGRVENGSVKEQKMKVEGVLGAEKGEPLSSNMSNNNVDLDGEGLEELLKGIDCQDNSDLSFWQDDRQGSESTGSLATPESWTTESPNSEWSSSCSSFRERKDSIDDVFVVDLEKGEAGLGLGLVDGQHTVLKSPGIYICKVLPGGSANQCKKLRVGDRILAVNGTSLVGADYDSAMNLIKNAGDKLRILVGKSDNNIAMKITASSC
ncbi:ras-associating and dilute domain-containing protein isoform X1 [Strongylocentrotus purpuratus]|uniref:Ras-associating and dilute domain-containing protein n=2 Tax=Strongylocentrotus purpuratus TaxID=7668 RepID=A0A7M7NRX3_STRPU|nr:ras-associating and dilute domain-containing protein isoform X1 [Strongylocentrotus purpuratus]